MDIIIDNNILFSLMNPRSTASILQKEITNLYAPDFIKSELEEHEEECMDKSGLKKEDFQKRKAEIFSKIQFIDAQDYKSFLKKAIKLVPDEDDVPYIALSLSLNISIWSNDSHLKVQNAVQILTTEELVDVLF